MLTAPRYDAKVIASALEVDSVTFLGRGTYGDTWRTGDRAVKIICVDGYPPERVAREVGGLSRVDSPNVVRLHGTASVVLDGTERPALYFEYVEGGDLQHQLDTSTRPTPEQATALLLGLLCGVRDLHAAQGTVHRDIKPANVALRDGQWESPVILDLGLAKSTTESTMTIYPGMLGTPLYMAPEQLQGKRARKAADLFAVGVTVRTVLMGVHPFYEAGASYTNDEALARIEAGPAALPDGLLPASVSSVLDLLVAYTEYERGSATSNLRRMGIES